MRIGTEHRSGVQVPYSGQTCRLSMNSVVVSKAEGIIILYPWNLINLADEKEYCLSSVRNIEHGLIFEGHWVPARVVVSRLDD